MRKYVPVAKGSESTIRRGIRDSDIYLDANDLRNSISVDVTVGISSLIQFLLEAVSLVI